jgi:hypothetical protein
MIGAASTFMTVVMSLWTFATRPTRDNAQTLPIRVYMASLLTTLLITLIAASLIWFSTLRERTLFTPIWTALPTAQKIYIQNDLKCCGWFAPTHSGLFSDELMVGFCEDPDIIKPDPDPNVTLGCVDKFDKKADDVLNNTFTLVSSTSSFFPFPPCCPLSPQLTFFLFSLFRVTHLLAFSSSYSSPLLLLPTCESSKNGKLPMLTFAYLLRMLIRASL